eukprot:gene8168-12628_t
MLLLLEVVLAILVLGYLLSKYADYKNRIVNVETGKSLPKGSGFFDFIPTMILPLHESVARKNTKKHQRLGPMMSIYQLFRPIVSVATPELAKAVLTDSKTFEKSEQRISKLNEGLGKLMNEHNVVFVNGEEWKRQRKSINPGFYDLSIYASQIAEKTNTTMDFISKNLKIYDIHDLLQKMTLDVLGSTIFSHEFNSLKGSLGDDLEAYNEVMGVFLNLKNILYLFVTRGFKSILPYHSNLTQKSTVLYELMRGLIKESKEKLETGGKPTSMLDFMTEALIEGEMSQEELEANVFIFFVAGHETTAKSLSFAMQLLAKHPEIQEKARKEVKEVLGDKECDYDSCSKLDYLSMVIKEAMRLFPPVGAISRTTTKDVVLGGYKIPKNTMVAVSMFSIHHSPDVYEDPEEFKPERWSSGNKISNFAWIPFSISSRVCVGNNFSLIEQKMFLSTLLQKFTFKLTDMNASIEEDPSTLILGPKKNEIKFQPIL